MSVPLHEEKERADGRGRELVCNVNQSVGLVKRDYPITLHPVTGSKTLVERFVL